MDKRHQLSENKSTRVFLLGKIKHKNKRTGRDFNVFTGLRDRPELCEILEAKIPLKNKQGLLWNLP